MISKSSIETAYSFFHQKQRVYIYSNIEWQKDDIECAIVDYVNGMAPELYAEISNGNPDFLRDHQHFATDIDMAVFALEKMLFT